MKENCNVSWQNGSTEIGSFKLNEKINHDSLS